MWKVKRMNTARIVVLTIAIGAGGIAAGLASGSDHQPVAPDPVAELQTIDILVANGDIGLGQSLKAKDMQWQTWPAASASDSFISNANAMTLARARQSGAPSLVGYGLVSQQSVQT
jgi:pilus assembly protein CpaB